MTVVADHGVVALLFTDLVGSTELLARLGDDAAEDLRHRHFSLLRQAIADLRIEPLRQRSEPDDIGKQDGDLPTLPLHHRRGHQRR